jgi:hypothetical protein
MNKPEIRIIQSQQEEINQADVSQNEIDMLLSKYGYSQKKFDNSYTDSNNNLTFEEMVRLEEEKNKNLLNEKRLKMKSSKPYTFDGDYDSETSYGTDSESGFTFKVNIVSDMPIPKKY